MIDSSPNIFRSIQKVLSLENANAFFEDYSVLRINGFQCNNDSILRMVKTFATAVEREKVGSYVLTGEILRDLDLSKTSIEDIENDILTLVINKFTDTGFYHFFTVTGLSEALEQQEFAYSATRVWIAEEFQEFSSITTDYLRWGSETQSKTFEWQGLTDSRTLVRDLSTIVDLPTPRDIRPWLMRPDQNIMSSDVLNVWKVAAAKRLSMTLPNEIRISNTERKVSFRGERLREVVISEMTNEDQLSLFSTLHESAQWVYANLQDSEIKHTLLNYQLASEWTGETKWPNKVNIERAVKSAREAYKLHLQGSNRELLKAYNEIKNSLQDEVSKVAENTSGLVANFWRDFAIAAAVLVFHFVTSSTNLSAIGIRILYTATAVFLLLSLLITVITNSRFIRIMQDNRDMWRQRLYPFIDNKNYDELVKRPISRGLAIYNLTVIVTCIIYLIMSAYLMYVAYFTGHP